MTEVILANFLEGLKRSVDYRSAIEILVQHNKLKQLFKDCFLKNAFLFFAGTYALDVFLWLTATKQGVNSPQNVSFLKKILFKILENLFFVLPMYTISSLYNGAIYSDIAMISYKAKKATERNHLKMKHPQVYEKVFKASPSGKNVLAGRDVPVASIKETVDRIYSIIVHAIFLLQISITSSLPLVGGFLQIFQESWLFSWGLYQLYFDTVGKFYTALLSGGNAATTAMPELMGSHHHPKNLTSDERFKLFENNWAYFLGFGVPFAVVKLFFPFMMATGVWAMLYPFFIVLVVKASLPKSVKKNKHFPIGIFFVPQFFVNKILPLFFNYFLGGAGSGLKKHNYVMKPVEITENSSTSNIEKNENSSTSSSNSSVFSSTQDSK